MIHISECRLGEKLFTHIDPDDGHNTVIAVDRIIELVKEREPVLVPVSEKDAARILTHRGVEDHRLNRLDNLALRIPVLFCELITDNTWLLADGNHRYVKHAMLGRPFILAHLV